MVRLKWILLRSSKAVSLTAIVLHPDTGSTGGPQKERNWEFLFWRTVFFSGGREANQVFFSSTFCSDYIWVWAWVSLCKDPVWLKAWIRFRILLLAVTCKIVILWSSLGPWFVTSLGSHLNQFQQLAHFFSTYFSESLITLNKEASFSSGILPCILWCTVL